MSGTITAGVRSTPRPRVERRPTSHDVPLLTVVVPTRNEVRNVALVAERAAAAITTLGFAARLLFVDDSDDATPAALRHQRAMGRPVDVAHRPPARRRGGRTSAVAEGIAAADSPFVAVMDGDLGHPPELLVALLGPLLDGRADVTVGVPFGGGARRPFRWSRRAARVRAPSSRAARERLEGFFAFRRAVLGGTGRTVQTTPTLVELLARGDRARVVEVPYPAAGRLRRRAPIGALLGIHSPSGLTAEEIGLPIGQDIAEGITSGTTTPTGVATVPAAPPVATDAALGLASPAGPVAVTMVTGKAGQAATGGGGVTIGQLSVDVTVRRGVVQALAAGRPVRPPVDTSGHAVARSGPRRRGHRPEAVDLVEAGSGSGTPAASVAVLDTGRVPARRPRLGRVLDATPTRVVLAALLVVGAFWYPIRALVGSWDPTRALTVVAVVPFLAAILLVALAAPAPGEPAIHDRQVDLLIGIPSLAGAVAIVWLLPRSIGAAFWVERVDVLALPLFVAGVLAVLFGTRALWRERWAVLFLLFAWPPVIRALLARAGPPLENVTLDGVTRIAGSFAVTRVGETARFVAAGALIDLGPGGSAGAVGVLAGVLAIAVALAMAGSVRRRAAWVVAVVCTALTLNLLRLALALASAVNGRVAVTHLLLAPGAVVLTSLLGVGALVVPSRRFGLTLRAREEEPSRAPSRSRAALLVTMALALAAAFVTAGLTRYAPLADALGSPRVSPIAQPPLRLPGFVVEDRGRRQALLGPIVTREYVARRAATTGAPVTIDAIASADPAEGAVSDLRARYPLPGYRMRARASVPLGRGVEATVVTFVARGGLRWDALTWVWPVRGHERYERVVVHAGAPEARVRAIATSARRSAHTRVTTEALRAVAARLVASATAGGGS